jgi:hypothetical protein
MRWEMVHERSRSVGVPHCGGLPFENKRASASWAKRTSVEAMAGRWLLSRALMQRRRYRRRSASFPNRPTQFAWLTFPPARTLGIQLRMKPVRALNGEYGIANLFPVPAPNNFVVAVLFEPWPVSAFACMAWKRSRFSVVAGVMVMWRPMNATGAMPFTSSTAAGSR